MATNAISDDELRDQLQNLGENVGPVTPSTRPLLLRKLKKLQKESTVSSKETKRGSRRNKSSVPSSQPKRQSPSRRLLGFSSDEEESQSNSGSRRRVSIGRRIGSNKEEVDRSRDNVDSSMNTSDRRSNSTVPSLNNSSSVHDEFSDSDSTSYTGPFHRGSYRFRSFRRKKDSPESTKSNRQVMKEPTYSNEIPDMLTEGDTTDGLYRSRPERNSFSSFLNIAAWFIIVICGVLLGTYFLTVFHVDKYGITSIHGSLPFCRNNVKTNCLDKGKLKDRYTYFLIELLSKQAGQFDCSDESVMSRNISKVELMKKLDEKITHDFPDLSEEKKIQLKPEVINLLNEQNETIRLYDENNNVVSSNKPGSIKYYESLKPDKPLICRIQQSCSRVVTGMLLVAFVLLLLFGVYYGVRNHWRKEEEDTLLMYKFVENIIDILRKHHDACKTDKDLPPYLPIPHVRDMLIKPADRKTKAKVWSRAVRFLSANESRIRVESQRIAGEDFEVWRWIHIMSPKHNSHKVSLQDTKRPKCWQGQAFENFQWAVNPPVISPTPCLKIRNMFDPDVELEDHWHVIIQDAILEKCIDAGANIVHIAVDKSSSEGCVYVKCDSNNSAGVAFKSLHGSWFDGRLVAVKYLTLRRYHQRFPKALTATGSLRPSGTSPSSLVTLDPEEDMDANDSETEV